MKKILSLLFVSLLIAPAVAWVVGLNLDMDVDRLGLEPPGLSGADLLSNEYYLAFDQYVHDSFNLRSPLLLAKSWVGYHVFRTTDSPDVHIGRNGWLYGRKSIEGDRKEASSEEMDVGRFVLELHALERIIQASGRGFFYIVAPDKSTIYPEFVGFVPQTDSSAPSRYDLFLENTTAHPLQSLVRLDEKLKEEKERGAQLYDKTGTTWNGVGAMVAAHVIHRQLLRHHDEKRPPDYSLLAMADNGDLHRKLMGLSPSVEPEPVQHFVGSDRPDLPVGILYGDAFIKNLLPYMVHMFRQLDVIRADRIPSRLCGEDLIASDFVILEEAESEIGMTAIELDRVFSLLEDDAHIPGRVPLDLGGVVPVSHISLDLRADGLAIKSVGPQSVFALPSLSGSDHHVFRVLKLSMEASQPDLMTIESMNTPMHVRPRPLKAGHTEVYVALPFQESLSLRIGPGQKAGLFLLRSAEILGFSSGPGIERQRQEEGSSVAVVSREIEDTRLLARSGEGASKSETTRGGPAVPAEKTITTDTDRETDVEEEQGPASDAFSLAVTDFEEGRIFQRRGQCADIVVSGIYTGLPHAIEARVVTDGTFEEIVPWTVIDDSPHNGIFLGVLPEVPQGGWYNVHVRDSRNHTIASEGSHKWGVGVLVACLGQSNMKEWFYTGTALKAHPLLRRHTAQGWTALGETGNAAIAFGNMIIERLDIPVGLLDYSKNGSGLRKEADWGTGYWEDTTPGSIYDRFLTGLSDAGGAVEFVVWVQGEADAARGTVTEEEYGRSLESFITNQVRADAENGSDRDHLPFLVVLMIKRPVGRDEPHQAIRNAQKHVAENLAECYLAATTLDLENHGKQHLTPKAYTTLGRRVAQTVLFVLGEEQYHRGPEVAEITSINDKTLDIRIRHRGGTDLTPVSDITGWEVLADGSPIPIAQVYREDPETIRIALERSLTGKTEIRYLYGAMPDASRPVRDNSVLSLPLEEYHGGIQSE